jgi:aprataxin
VLFFDDELVVARDAYPKSRTHLLVLARDTRLAEGPKAMRSTDAALVRRMARVGEAHARTLAADSRGGGAADDAERFRFRCGFHASPSMRTAHMHVVSGDLRGVGMKTRRHWNSFATSFFKEAEETARDLERAEAESTSGDASSGTRWDVAELERVVAMTPLRCHKCGDGPFPTMPKLFTHTDACVRAGFSTRTDAL